MYETGDDVVAKESKMGSFVENENDLVWEMEIYQIEHRERYLVWK